MATEDEQRRQQQELWAGAATGWERHSAWFDAVMRPVTAWLCDAAGLRPGMRVLDVACGAGQPGLTAIERVRPGGSVVGVDLSPQMLAVARRRAAGVPDVEFQHMPAERLELGEASVDAVICRYGLMLTADPIAAAREMRRVLRPGGRVALSVWAELHKNPYFFVPNEVLGRYFPMPAPDPDAPGAFRLSAPGALARVLEAAGFTDLRIEELALTVDFPSRDDYWRIQSEMSPTLTNARNTLPPDELARVEAAIRAAVEPYVAGGRVLLPATPLLAAAS